MHCLASDPDQAALLTWGLRNHTVLEPVEKLPEAGQLVVSRLNVLTPEQLGAVMAAGIELVTADGLDTRACKGVGDVHRPLLGIFARAVEAWRLKPVAGMAGSDAAELEQLRGERERLLERVIEAEGVAMEAREGLGSLSAKMGEMTVELEDLKRVNSRVHERMRVAERALEELSPGLCVKLSGDDAVSDRIIAQRKESPVAGPESSGGSGVTVREAVMSVVLPAVLPVLNAAFGSMYSLPAIDEASGPDHSAECLIDQATGKVVPGSVVHHPPVEPATIVPEARTVPVSETPPKGVLKPGLAAFNERRRAEKAAKLASA